MPRGDFEKLTPLMIEAVWNKLRSGMAVKPASRALGLCPGTVRAYLERCGGIRPHLRSRGRGRLGLAEREEISRGLAEGCSLRQIARRLHRAPSTISREVRPSSWRAVDGAITGRSRPTIAPGPGRLAPSRGSW